MIVTVTPNPSVDRTIFLDTLVRGEVNRGKRSMIEPSGKGVNVSLALRAHGHPTVAVLPVGGRTGTHMVDMLTATDIPFHVVPIAGSIRSNISLAEPDGIVTKINEHGPSLTGPEVATLQRAALDAARGAHWLAVCGSLPDGVGDDFYGDLALTARHLGPRVAVDTSGEALRWAIKAAPDVIKPNREELAEAIGSPLRCVGDVVTAAQTLRARGARSVLASLGPDGAVLVDDHGVVHGEAPVDRPLSTVGAGDALLAGFLAADANGRYALETGLRWAAAAVQHHGTLLTATNTDTPVVLHDQPDLTRPLRD